MAGGFCACALKVAKMVPNMAKVAKIQILYRAGHEEVNYGVNFTPKSTCPVGNKSCTTLLIKWPSDVQKWFCRQHKLNEH